MTRIFAASIIVLGFAVSAAAQPPQWTEKVKLGKWVYVTTQTGERVDGVTGQITEEGLVVATPVGVRTIPYREMRWVQKRDAAWPGALIGVVAGVAVGIVWALASDCTYRQCREKERGLVMTGALYGGLTGWIADGQVDGKTTLFQADPSRKVTLAPRRGGVSARVSFSW